jgi:ankyrin repeat protein
VIVLHQHSLVNTYSSTHHLASLAFSPGRPSLSEAVRGGHLDVVEYLLEKGLDINERTHHGEGGSPLWWAKKEHGKNHEIVKFLEEHGAVEIAPNN